MATSINLLAIILSVLSLIVAIVALVIVLAMKWSTHKIEWKPLTIQDPLAPEEEFQSFTEPSEDIVEEALKLSKKGKERKKKEEDPLDTILESSNF